MPYDTHTTFNIGDKVACCVYGEGIIIEKQRPGKIDRWFDGDTWLQVMMPNYPYCKVYFDISGRCAEEGDWLVNHPTLFHQELRPNVITRQPNRPFYLGERVIDLMWGKGTIISTNWHDSRPLRVAFDNYPYKNRDGYPQSLLYRPDGTRMQSDKQRLFHEDQAPTIVTR
ncbi:hypothetical protein [Aeromonas sp. Y318-1]|uniref:hypothetical protein n=1 Tax=Aeromonas TaxID=642 RepID=UPI0022E69CEE|nr:hypothetical protein [Aeromonas sp. Y318-1]